MLPRIVKTGCFILILVLGLMWGGLPAIAAAIEVSIHMYDDSYDTLNGTGVKAFNARIFGTTRDVIYNAKVSMVVYDGSSRVYSGFSSTEQSDITESGREDMKYYKSDSRKMQLPFGDDYSVEVTVNSPNGKTSIKKYFDLRPIDKVPQNMEISDISVPSDGIVNLSWTKVGDASAYKVFLNPSPGFNNEDDFYGVTRDTGLKLDLNNDPRYSGYSSTYVYIIAYNDYKRVGRSPEYEVKFRTDGAAGDSTGNTDDLPGDGPADEPGDVAEEASEDQPRDVTGSTTGTPDNGPGTATPAVVTPGQTTPSPLPTQLPPVKCLSIAAGTYHMAAAADNGTVWTWCRNSEGQLGDRTKKDKHIATQLLGLSGVAFVDAGTNFTIALKYDSTVMAWGANFKGQLGDGTRVSKPVPVQVSGIKGVQAVAAGEAHSVALLKDGTVWTWGDNSRGQLGVGTTEDMNTPIQVSGLHDIISIAAGGAHTIALKSDGTVWAWGDNSKGQLGDLTMMDRSTPVQVAGLTDINSVACGKNHSVALKNDGTIWVWGDNEYGQLGDNLHGYEDNKSMPRMIAALDEIKAIAAGDFHTIALKNDGTVWVWGHNKLGQLGGGNIDVQAYRYTPASVIGLTGVNTIIGGGYYSAAVKNDGTVLAWGNNSFGQLGDNTNKDTSLPVSILGILYSSREPATLSSVMIDGSECLDFEADRFVYDIVLPAGTKNVPVVTAQASEHGDRIIITPARALPGSTTIMVSSGDGLLRNIYTIRFTVSDGKIADLSSITLSEGTLAPAFSPAVTAYSVVLKAGSKNVPEVKAVASDPNAAVSIKQAEELPGKAVIEVTSQDGTIKKIYTIDFSVAKKSSKALPIALGIIMFLAAITMSAVVIRIFIAEKRNKQPLE